MQPNMCNSVSSLFASYDSMTDLKVSTWFCWGFFLITECGFKIRWVSARGQACVNNPVCRLYCVARARRLGRTIPFAFCLCAIILPGQSCPLCVLSPKATNCIWGWRDRGGFLFWKWIAITCKPTLKRHDSCLTASSSSGGPSFT